ncbi:MAG TPA: transcription termination factor NusA [Candidatus Hydrogenedentes bacterium]|nr:transcription termination factor NusA [Candidatus Hydrogenedentota bacterium]HOL77460.1 transcription termination factor NusA [Candidatus Hydrogenedentota bacterium]HPO86293.1 transcription termination factor NusA [Candidatus Hydrogenedentota bacterium]
MDVNLQLVLQQLQAEKSIDRDALLEAIRSAIESAARRSFPPSADIRAELDPNTLNYKIFQVRQVADPVSDPVTEISLEEARQLNPDAQVGDRLKVPTEPRDFGRIAAQTAKQVIIQRIKDAERENVYEEFKKREGELITGVVKRVAHGNIIVSLGKAEAIVPHREQNPRESFKPGDRIQAYLLEVEKTPKGPQIILSRASAELVRLLFDLEVPEIYDGTVVIKSIAREAGSRTKIAVASNDPNVDPVGACVGMKGARVRAVVEELNGEKIDIVRWSDDPVEMCANALNPADIVQINVDEATRTISVVVPHDQLSLAIGKRGQNARLASKLMGWNIDIRGDTTPEGREAPEEATPDESSASDPTESLQEVADAESQPGAREPEKESDAGA